MATFGLYTKEVVPILYSVTYDGNGNTSGTVPVDSSGYEDGDSVTVMGNSGSLVKGPLLFTEWNTAFDGSGISYTQLSTLNMGTANVVLYAIYTLNPPIQAEFIAGVTSGIAPLTVDFTNLSIGAVTGWDWTFGDGNYSTDENPSHEYLYGGGYTVRLNAYDATSSNLKTKYDYIFSEMTVGFEAIPLGGDPPVNIYLDNTGSGAVSWRWRIYKDIPDPSYSSYTPYIDTTEESFYYNFTENGKYSVWLEGYSDYMWWWPWESQSEFEYFSVGVIADFTSNVRGLVPAGTQIDFQDLSTRDPDQWLWDFGDGTTSFLQNPSHIYTAENGSFDVTLTAFKNGDQSDSCSSEDYIRLTSVNWVDVVNDWYWTVIHEITEFNNVLYTVTDSFDAGPFVRRSVDDASTWTSVLDATGYSLTVKGNTLYMPTADGTNGGMYMTTDGTNWNRSDLIFNSL